MSDTGKTVPPSELFLFGNSSSSRHSPAGIHARGLHTRLPRGLDANQEAGERRVSCVCVHVRVCAGVYVSVHLVPVCIHAGMCVCASQCAGVCVLVCVHASVCVMHAYVCIHTSAYKSM